jgi:DNA-binding transcriptional MocR family regulator
MTMWQPRLEGRSGPRYRAIADALAEDAARGRLRPGSQLPTHRDLADRLGVTVGTITRAYAEAARKGVVSGEVGRGTFVRGPASEPVAFRFASQAEPGLIDMSVNLPPAPPDPAALAHALTTISKYSRLGSLLDYAPEGGAPEHRAAGASWIARAGLEVAPDQVLVSSGSQHGMTAVLAGLLRPGDLVLTESLTYPGMKALAGLLHLRLQGVAMDEHGLRPDALRTACRRGSVKAIYCVPTLHNPTTSVMPEARRREVVAIARQHDVLIVEDDVHGPLIEDRPPLLVALAPDITVHLSGTAKTLAPGLRIGYILAPKALVPRLATAIRTTTWMAAPLLAEVASVWIRDGTADLILAGNRKESAARHRLAVSVLGRFQIQAHPAAHHLWLQLPESRRSETFAEQARRAGVAVTPAQAFVVGSGAAPRAVRVCLGVARDRAQLEKGLRILAGVLDQRTDDELLVV